jgi:hypothetical protein
MTTMKSEGTGRRWMVVCGLGLGILGSAVLALAQASRASSGPSSRPSGPDARRPDGAVKVGQDAPDFDLARLDIFAPNDKGEMAAKLGAGTVKLSSFVGKKPVCLIFSSYT